MSPSSRVIEDDDDTHHAGATADGHAATTAHPTHAATVLDLRGIELRTLPEVHGGSIPERVARETRRSTGGF